jgi:hypothetical protein
MLLANTLADVSLERGPSAAEGKPTPLIPASALKHPLNAIVSNPKPVAKRDHQLGGDLGDLGALEGTGFIGEKCPLRKLPATTLPWRVSEASARLISEASAGLSRGLSNRLRGPLVSL